MEGHNIMVDPSKLAALKGEIDGIEQSIRWLTQHMPTHQQYLAKYCPAKDAA